jgi:hypothetical protein
MEENEFVEFVEGKDGVMAIGFCVEGIQVSEEVKEGSKAVHGMPAGCFA